MDWRLTNEDWTGSLAFALNPHLKLLLKESLINDEVHLPIIVNKRQKAHVLAAIHSLEQYKAVYKYDIVVAAEYLRLAALSIGMITGHIDSEQVLDSLFANFCIGKW